MRFIIGFLSGVLGLLAGWFALASPSSQGCVERVRCRVLMGGK